MATTAAPVSRRALQARSIAEAFRITAEDFPDRVAVRTKDDEISLTWGELRERVDALAGGLAALGVQRGDTVALMLSNRPEFHLADLAVMSLGAVPFSIYLTSAPEQIAYVVQDAGAKVAIVEEEYLAKLPELEHIVVLEGARGEGTLAWSDVEGSNPGFDVESAWRAVGPEDLLTLIYTSGTTGPPKGVQLVHRNLLAAVESIERMIQFPDGAKVISWLPSAHIAERAAHHYLPIVYAMTITSCDDPRQVLSYLPVVKPTWFFAVPRIWEKLKAGLEAMLASQPPEQREPAERALAAARQKVELEQAGEPVPDELAAAVAKADAELFSGLRAMLGLDELEAVNVGAAPTPREVLVFFHAIGVEVAELWGMSETCGSGCCNPPGKVRIGTVGPPAPGVEIKLAEDGEVLMRSAVVMTGYRNLPERTAEALDADGWLHTGDIGEFDEEGYLRIVDRKKELIISAAGKNMSPANIESTLKGASPLIGQVCTIGDGRPYNTALIVLDTDFAPAWAASNGREGASLEDLADRRGHARGGPGRGRRRQRPARAGRADQEVHDRPGRLGAGRGRADADDEAQAQADRGEVRRRDRGDVPQVKVAAGIVLALAALAAGASPAAAVTDEPDLVIRLPGEPSASSVAPVFVDAYEEPGKLLYRFDAVIANQGGTLDLFRGPTGGVEQAIYQGGEPPVAPKPDETPSGGVELGGRRARSSTRRRRRTSTGTSRRPPATRWWPAARPARRTRSASACSTRSGRRTGSPTRSRARRGSGGAGPTSRPPRRCGWGSRRAAPTSTPRSSSASGSTSPGSSRGGWWCGERRTRCTACSRATRPTTTPR